MTQEDLECVKDDMDELGLHSEWVEKPHFSTVIARISGFMGQLQNASFDCL